MSYDRVTRSLNRHHSRRLVRNQTAVWLLYNTQEWLAAQHPSGFRKNKAMNCSCRVCLRYAATARKNRLVWELERNGMCEKQHLRSSGFRNRVTKEWTDSWKDYVSEEYEGL